MIIAMDQQELEHMLHENMRLAKENNRILVKLYKYQRFQRNSRILYWVIVAALAFGAYYYVKPYVDNIFGAYDSITNTFLNAQHVFGGSSASKSNVTQ